MSLGSVARVAVIGTGMMGRGIAEVAAARGVSTVLVKATPGDAEAARKQIAGALERSVQKGKLAADDRDAALARLVCTAKFEDIADADLVIESVSEDLACKHAVYARIDAVLGADAVLASNTSSLPLAALARGVAHPDRFVGLHFFSPVAAMQLVELAAPSATSPGALARARAFVEQIGKTPVVLGDTAGYIVNRLLVPFLLDAITALDKRVAPAASIDTAMKLGCAHPLGPLALADAIGLDVVLAMADTLQQELADARYVAPALLRRLVEQGHLGKKSGAGIYVYAGANSVENPALRAA